MGKYIEKWATTFIWSILQYIAFNVYSFLNLKRFPSKDIDDIRCCYLPNFNEKLIN